MHWSEDKTDSNCKSYYLWPVYWSEDKTDFKLWTSPCNWFNCKRHSLWLVYWSEDKTDLNWKSFPVTSVLVWGQNWFYLWKSFPVTSAWVLRTKLTQNCENHLLWPVYWSKDKNWFKLWKSFPVTSVLVWGENWYEGRAKSSVTNRLPWFYPRYFLKCFTALEWCVE